MNKDLKGLVVEAPVSEKELLELSKKRKEAERAYKAAERKYKLEQEALVKTAVNGIFIGFESLYKNKFIIARSKSGKSIRFIGKILSYDKCTVGWERINLKILQSTREYYSTSNRFSYTSYTVRVKEFIESISNGSFLIFNNKQDAADYIVDSFFTDENPNS